MATLQCSRCGGTRYDTSHRCEKGCGVMTASNEVESLRERLEKVEAERDELSRDWDSEHYHRLAVERDRDALAASYEALANEVRGIMQDSDGVAGYHLNGDVADWDEFELGGLLSEQGPDCLARRDARMKAEALHEFLMFPRMGDEPVRAKAVKLRDGYRQQAVRGGDE